MGKVDQSRLRSARAQALVLVLVSVLLLSNCKMLRTRSVPIRAESVASLSVNNVSVAEGHAGTAPATFTLTLSSASSRTVSVRYATATGSARGPDDFRATSGTRTFSPGQTTKKFTVPVNGDRFIEPDESFSIKLSAPINATIAKARATGTINNDDSTPSLTIGNVTVPEGNLGTTNTVFTVNLSTPSAGTTTVDYATADDSASAPSDYSTASGTLVFPPLSTARTLTIPVRRDTALEEDEGFFVNLFNATHASIADGTAYGTILNDDLPMLSVGDVTVAEGDTGTVNAVFPVTLSAPTATPVTVDYATLDALATSPSDYSQKLDTLTFAPGDTSTTVTIAINGDTIPEPDETFYVHVENAIGATIADAFGQGTILGGDVGVPSLSISSPTPIAEGNTGTANLVFTVTMSAPSAGTVTVDYTTADGVATAAADYTAVGGTLTYTPGQTSKLITVPVAGDGTVETDETFLVLLSNPTDAVIAGTGIVMGTITNDDTLPTVTLAAPSATNEGNTGTTNFVFTATLSTTSTNTVTVDYATADGSATAASGDYTSASGTLTFSPGQTNKQIIVLAGGDATVETNETFTMYLSSPANATIAGTGIGTGTITNDDTLPTVTIAAPSATNEGNTGSTNFVFTVTLSAPSASTVTVDYTTIDGSATSPSDYSAQNGTVSFVGGQTTKPITIAVNGDTAVEINETFTVNLSSPANATIAGTGIGTGAITNDDTLPTVTIAAPSATNEGNTGTTSFVFTATLSAISPNTVTVDYATADGSATEASGDYTSASGTLTFSPGQTNKQIAILVSGDTTVETSETFTMNLSDAVSATIAGTGIGTGTITNDDNLPGLTLAAPAATNESNAGTANFVFTVTLSAPSANTVTVDYTTIDGSATEPSDYGADSGTVSFSPGQTSQPITIAVHGDTVNEINETFTVNLSNPANATLTTASASATITNDDTPPTLTIAAPAATNEGNSGTTSFVFTVTLSANSANTVTVDYTTADGSATAASGDYTTANGTLSFSPGQTNKQVAILVNGDTSVETSETFTVNLSSPVNATITGTGIGTGTITNDDNLPGVTLAAPAATNEGNVATTNFAFTVTLSAPSTSAVTVDYATVDGSATEPSDYTAQSGTLTYSPGQTSQQITIPVNGDTAVETNEAFTVNLSNPVNATLTTASASATITNDDTLPALTITSPAAVTEGNAGTTLNAVFTVTLGAISANTVTVDYTTADGSAVASGDYTGTSGTLTFGAGQTSQQIAVIVKGDTLNEINETFTVYLSNPANATIAGTGIGTETINNDDTVPSLSINNVSQAEGTGGTTNLVFTVTLSTASGLPVTVDFATANGTAGAPGDYASQTGTLTFSPGQTTKTVTVEVTADAVNEANETFTVVLSSPANATITTATGTGTIQNDD